MNTSILAQEIEELNAQVTQIRGKLGQLEQAKSKVDAELDTYATAQQKIDALRDACNALDRLTELKADRLFWEDMPGRVVTAEHTAKLRERVVSFEKHVQGFHDKKAAIETQIDRHLDALEVLQEEIDEAYDRDEKRKDEFVIEREISPIPFRRMVMPWSMNDESEKRFRRSVLVAMLLSLCFSYLIPLVNVPVPDETEMVVEIPKRLAMLVKKEPPRPEPVVEKPVEAKKPEEPEKAVKPPEKTKKKTTKKVAKKAPGKPKKAKVGGSKTARKKAESTGVLAFKAAFTDLIKDAPVGNVGLEAPLSKKAPKGVGGEARAKRSLVAMQAKNGASSGIANARVSRNLGTGGGSGSGGGGGGNAGQLTGVSFARVESTVADATEEARPLSDGVGPARTDEEIQIIFDRYKAALYRIYNKELRKNPTLRGKMLLRLTIEPGGELSTCALESTDLASDDLVAKILTRVRRFNFGAKPDVPTVTILYPIDFLPAA